MDPVSRLPGRKARRQAGTQASKQAGGQAGRQSGRQADRQAGRQTGRQVGRHARQAGRHGRFSQTASANDQSLFLQPRVSYLLKLPRCKAHGDASSRAVWMPSFSSTSSSSAAISQTSLAFFVLAGFIVLFASAEQLRVYAAVGRILHFFAVFAVFRDASLHSGLCILCRSIIFGVGLASSCGRRVFVGSCGRSIHTLRHSDVEFHKGVRVYI